MKRCVVNHQMLHLGKEGWLQFVDYQKFAMQYRSYKTWYILFNRHFVAHIISGSSFIRPLRWIFNIPYFSVALGTWNYLFINCYCDLHRTSTSLLSMEFETQYINRYSKRLELSYMSLYYFWQVFKKLEKKITKRRCTWDIIGMCFGIFFKP